MGPICTKLWNVEEGQKIHDGLTKFFMYIPRISNNTVIAKGETKACNIIKVFWWIKKLCMLGFLWSPLSGYSNNKY